MSAAPSPLTGWTREHWAALADRLLLAVRPHASPHRARVAPPGPAGGYGADVDGLEGFARTFLAAGFRLAGEDGRDPLDLAGWYAGGLAAGTDPGSAERWPRPEEHAQAKVEAASIALVLDLTRPWLWDLLDDGVRERVVDYLSAVVGDDTYPRCNWVWFRIVVETFLRSVGGPWRAGDVEADLAAHDSFHRGGGWFADGDERAFDHYGGWALHLYPVLWARMRGATDLADRSALDTARLDRYLTDRVHLVGADGGPLVQGRSLAYRFAAAAPFWAGALAGVPSTGPGLLRRAASGIVAHFADRGAPDDRGLLTLGWHGEWPRLAQSYSGPSSPYWAAKGLLGLALPADHPVWTAVEEPLPVERADRTWAAAPPGWLVSATRADGLVRVVNHGTDHEVEGSSAGDSPLYARLGYSTATAPLLSERAWTSPLDQSVVLLDDTGAATHRAGMRTLFTRQVGDAAYGASVARAHRVVPEPGQRDHGSGRRGAAHDVALITTASVVRGGWEVRCARVDPLPGTPIAATALRIGGWPLAGDPTTTTGPRRAGARAGDLCSVLVAHRGLDRVGVHTEHDASPLGPRSATPWAAGDVVAGRWAVAVIGLHAHRPRAHRPPAREPHGDAPDVALDRGTGRVVVRWPDGTTTAVDLPHD
ncbi:DUF2264 domain-containing protein [Saccharothrix longispora]|uniref:DUF2264 domain-containing protein n=1 Tax=Saccharothrix longispora TaxID=33920 RepID=UPI0028FD3D85|nr:DUF2264 domain-containing protein [Saccharothrix longispora]MDU0291809.1 DUF2264 domain-containing protein [Saccharothrix longispora]